MDNPKKTSSTPNPIFSDQDIQDISRAEELAYDLKVQDVMSRTVRVVSPYNNMRNVLGLFRQKQISGAPVIDGKDLVGIVSLEDLIRSMVANDLDADVHEYMTKNLATIHSYESVIKAIELFTKTGVGRLPVVDETGRLVGIITKGDITRGVLLALQKDYQEEEIRRYRASHLFEDIRSDRTTLVLRYRIAAGDFTHGGSASSDIKRALLRLGADPQLARRCGIAVYEAEMNLIIHTTSGGLIRVEIEPHRILMTAIDEGPGIPDISMAMQPGYSTATEEVRELGFGAGMGLINIQRCVDKMRLESAVGKGTKLEMKIYLQPTEKFREGGSETQE